MRRTFAAIVVLLAAAITALPLHAVDVGGVPRDKKIAEPIIVDVRNYRVTPETFRLAANRAFLQRNWRILTSEPTRVQATQTKHKKYPDTVDIEYRAEIRWDGDTIVIAFVPGYHSARPNWLRNLEKDLLIELQLQALTK